MFVLITAAASAQAYQLQKSLQAAQVIFADSQELPEVMLKNKTFIKIPSADAPSFAHIMLSTCLDLQVSQVFPLRKSEILALAEARQLFEEYAIKIMVPDLNNIYTYLDKNITGELVIKDGNNGEERGAFIMNAATELQLFNVG